MAKKLSLLIATVAAVALSVPALASGASLTMPANVLVKVGTGITSKSANLRVTTSLGSISCEQVAFAASVTKNNGAEFAAAGVGAGTSSSCFLGGTKAITLEDITVTELKSIGGFAGEMEVTFKAALPGVTCHFSSNAVGFGYPGNTDTFRIVNKNLAGVPAACKPGTLNAEFTVETTVGGGEVLLD